VTFCVIEHVGSVWIADVEEGHGPVDVGVKGAN
jgi:hypothetical protein